MVLPVAGDLRVDLHVRRHDDLQLAVAVHHDRAAGKHVRVHRHDDDGIQLRMHDRTTGGQRVGGGTGGRGDDQAVGLLAADELAVDIQLELDHPGRLARVQDHVVERIALPHRVDTATHLGIEEEAALDDVLAVQHLADLGLQFIRADVGEEAQATAVDPQHRHLVPGQRAGRAEHAAIAADHHHQVADFAHDLPRAGLQAVSGQDFGDGVLEDHMQVAIDQEFLQPADGIQHLGAAEAADDADIAKGFHAVPAKSWRAG